MTRPTIKRRTVLMMAALFLFQTLCALFFVTELVTEVFGLRHWSVEWQIRELLQVGASIGLTLGAVTGALLLRQTLRRIVEVERQVRAASGEFFGVMAECFDAWGLTPSERDVALFAVRGYSNAEIARLREKSEATIKSQMNAVFRKAEVSNRAQLLSQFVDVLIGEGGEPASATKGSAQAPVGSLPTMEAAQR